MQDNQKTDIRLVIGATEINQLDDVSIDSVIDVPADGWSVTAFNPVYDRLPMDVSAGQKIQLYYGKELVLTGICDSVKEVVKRDGRLLQIAGRDLAGQLIDCSVPLFNGKQLNLQELINRYVLSGDFASLFSNVKIQNNAWLKNKVSIEPTESVWDALAKAAQVTGQHVWLESDGTIVIGDPFANPYQVQQPLMLMYDGNQNNILDAEYEEDVSSVFSTIKMLSQDAEARQILSEATSSTNYQYGRLKLVSLGDVETQSEAKAALDKIKKDNDLQAYSLTVTVQGWTIDNRVWTAGMYVTVKSDVLSRATAKWMVLGRTLRLSRGQGQTTILRLKRQGDWAQPLTSKQHQDKTQKKKAKQALKKEPKP
ncbi:phage baseplate assembly protein [Acinetobacter ursingii]|uniref:phage baseplate assembly protein n=1 Tax=Acinetobacter ursingii TaxID=108980 RepID=UPI00124CC428|nr:hypothetical protein [Acinetobacter ursingii]